MKSNAPNIGRVTLRKLLRTLEATEETIRSLNYRDAPEFSRLRATAAGQVRATRDALETYLRHYTYGEITAGTVFKLHPSDACIYVKRKEGVKLQNADGTEMDCESGHLDADRVVYIRVTRGEAMSFE